MWSPIDNLILDQSSPKLTMATAGTVVQQGTSGNYATDGQRRKAERRIQRLRERRKAKKCHGESCNSECWFHDRQRKKAC